MNDFYNNLMYSVDLSDQLWNSYRFNHWLRMRKWWWAIFFWWLGIQMVNAYIVYVSMCEINKVPLKYRLTHYEFRCKVALAWINPEQYWHKNLFTPTKQGTGNTRKTTATDPDSANMMGSSGTRTKTRTDADNSGGSKGKKYVRPYVVDGTFEKQDHVHLNRHKTHFPLKVQKCQRCKSARIAKFSSA